MLRPYAKMSNACWNLTLLVNGILMGSLWEDDNKRAAREDRRAKCLLDYYSIIIKTLLTICDISATFLYHPINITPNFFF